MMVQLSRFFEIWFVCVVFFGRCWASLVVGEASKFQEPLIGQLFTLWYIDIFVAALTAVVDNGSPL